MDVTVYPVFIILPDLTGLSVTVGDGTNSGVANFSGPTSVFAVYFSLSPGSISFSARAPTTLKHFSFRVSWQCPVYYLSSSPQEQWSAGRTKGNFSIGNSQDVCLFHVSDTATDVAGFVDTESGYDRLYFQYSGSAALQFYTGQARTFTAVSNQATVFRWASDDTSPSNSFLVELSSPLSSLPCRRAVGKGTSSVPIILEDYTPVESDGRHAKQSAATLGLVIGVPIVVVLAAAVTAIVVTIVRRRRSAEGQRQPAMLAAINLDDMSGGAVRERAPTLDFASQRF
jgi:hypothetical protein